VQKLIGSYHFDLSFLFAQSSMSAPGKRVREGALTEFCIYVESEFQ
jgi:hypothetical protein